MSWYPGKFIERLTSRVRGQAERLPLPLARLRFLDRIEESIKEEEKDSKKYRELAVESERLGFPLGVTATLDVLSKDEARHKENLQRIKAEIEKFI